MADTGVFSRYKGFGDYQKERLATDLANQVAQAKIQRSMSGGDDPAPLQLANEFAKARAIGDTQRMNDILMFAKSVDKGVNVDSNNNYTQAPNYAQTVAGIEGSKSGAKQLAQKQVDLQINPEIAGAEAKAKYDQQLASESEIERAKELAKSKTSMEISDKAAVPILHRLSDLNKKTIDSRNPGLLQPITQAVDPEASTALDLMNQERLNLAAPLAKQLGVNPTDKDFQASLDRIFNVNSTKSSRQAQIQNLLDQAKSRQTPQYEKGKIYTNSRGQKAVFDGTGFMVVK